MAVKQMNFVNLPTAAEYYLQKSAKNGQKMKKQIPDPISSSPKFTSSQGCFWPILHDFGRFYGSEGQKEGQNYHQDALNCEANEQLITYLEPKGKICRLIKNIGVNLCEPTLFEVHRKFTGGKSYMNSGIIWADGDANRPVEEKISAAVTCYCKKFGQQPNTCQVHPDTKCADQVAGVQVKKVRGILKHDFFVGIDEEVARGS